MYIDLVGKNGNDFEVERSKMQTTVTILTKKWLWYDHMFI